MHVLFLGLARHQELYFQRLLDETTLTGRVVTPKSLPPPAFRGLRAVLSRTDWRRLVADKCHERQIKGKYEGRLYRLLLRLEILVMGMRIWALLERESPAAVGMWNGANRYCQVLLGLLPSEVRPFFFENGLLPDTTTLDPHGVNFLNSMPRDADFYYKYALQRNIAEQYKVTLIPRKARRADQVEVSLPEQFIFIPFQDDRDTQVRLFSPWVRDMRDLFSLGERFAEAGLTVVFKEHPSSKHEYPDLHARANNRLIFANGNSTEGLIRQSQFVVTINSTVGLESLLLAKPVMTLGQAFYSIDGLVVHAGSSGNAMHLALDYPNWPLDERVREGFIHFLKNEYCIPKSWRQPDQEHIKRVVARLSGQDGLAAKVVASLTCNDCSKPFYAGES